MNLEEKIYLQHKKLVRSVFMWDRYKSEHRTKVNGKPYPDSIVGNQDDMDFWDEYLRLPIEIEEELGIQDKNDGEESMGVYIFGN